MMSEAQGKVIILTGASRGIGLAIAHHLLSTSTSHKLILLARTHAPLAALRDQYGSARVEVLAGDVTDERIAVRAVEAAQRRWGRLDGLVVNHGSLAPVGRVGGEEEGEEGSGSVEGWRKGFEVNVFSVVGLIQASLPSLRLSHGTILLTSSGASITPYQAWGPYGASKAVLNHLAATLAVEEPHVTTISIRPGVVDTEMQREIREVYQERMSEADRGKFRGLKERGALLRPEQPGGVMARLVVGAGRELSGRFLSWDDEVLGGFREDA